jgi:hypothetical protein
VINEITDKEFILQLLLAECVRRLSKGGKHKVSITNAQLGRLIDGKYEVDFSESNDVRFILKFQKMQDDSIDVIENIIVPREMLVEKDESISSK